MQTRVPTFHVGVIMDGNGRWAEARGLSRVAGHARGARRVSEIVKACPDLGVTHLTLYAFSTENWRRPLAEVEGLMRIFRQYIREQDRGPAPQRRAGAVHRHAPPGAAAAARADGDARGADADCHGLNLTIAIDYGGRDELTRAVRALSREVDGGTLRAGGDRRGGDRGGARHPRPARSRTSSSAPRASCASRTSCSGRGPMPSTTSPRPPGPTSPSRAWRRRSRPTRRGSAASGRSAPSGADAGGFPAPEPQRSASRWPRRSASVTAGPQAASQGRLKHGRPAPITHEDKPLPRDPRLVARRGDLPDLPALVPGLERRRHRRPRRASSTGCPTSRASGSTRSGSRRSSPRRCSTSATT